MWRHRLWRHQPQKLKKNVFKFKRIDNNNNDSFNRMKTKTKTKKQTTKNKNKNLFTFFFIINWGGVGGGSVVIYTRIKIIFFSSLDGIRFFFFTGKNNNCDVTKKKDVKIFFCLLLYIFFGCVRVRKNVEINRKMVSKS